MYLEVSNPMDYRVGLYVRLSKEDENEGPSESVTNQKSLLMEFVESRRLSVFDTYIDESVIVEPSQKTLAAQGFLVWFNFLCSINGQQ